ncbi:MAG: 2Fe-2S iron-sulfur cluster-binding protein [Oligoflexus sp.]
MFSLFSKKKPTTATINSQILTVNPKETLLQSALRQGFDFPHSCRVGGCATCKCKLVSGRVKELTETAYVLSDQDLDEGFILACQSVPVSDIEVLVDMDRQLQRRSVTGKVIDRQTLTADICRLVIQLDETLLYKPGQYAEISIASCEQVYRSYSFATPPQTDSQISFFVRKVPGGLFSSHVHESNIIGQRVRVDGPLGDFYLRTAESPLLFVAGGSGLAPILAILEEGARLQLKRSVTLVFGARQEKDLYALNAIKSISERWQSTFRFMPVLSDEEGASSWTGKRGLVTDQIEDLLEKDSHAYLCGPPAMIDKTVSILQLAGIPRDHIYADRFTTRYDTIGGRHPSDLAAHQDL